MMKDPRENKAGNGRNEPPDLDELWREFNRRLQRLIGYKQLKGSGGIEPNKRNWYYSAGVLLAALGVWLGSGFYMVQQGQASVVLQLGGYKKTTSTGLHWRLPYPLQSHEIVDLSLMRSVEIGRNNLIRAANVKDSSVLTQEGEILNVRLNVRYYVDNARAFLFNNADPETGVMQAAAAAVREVVGQRKIAALLVNGQEQLGSAIIPVLQKNLDACKSGIRISEIVIQSVQLPEQMQSISAEMQKIKLANESQKKSAQTYANEIVPAAQGAATRMVNEAEGYKAGTIAQAHGEVARFKPLLAAFIKAPAATREHMYLSTMQQVYGSSTKIFVDGNKAASTQILFPFDGSKGKSLFSASQDSSGSDATQAKPREVGKAENTQSSDDLVAAFITPNSNANTAAANRSDNVETSSDSKESLRSRDFLRDRVRSEDAR